MSITVKDQDSTATDYAARPMTLGEHRVRLTFNPSSNTLVQDIKVKSADLIDLCERMKDRPGNSSETIRLIALAQTHYEDAAMWAVKAATA